MQTLLPELGGAPSTAPLDRDPSDELLVANVPLRALHLDVGERRPLKELRPDLTESEFVLALPMSLDASEVVARATEEGLTLSEPFVHKVRYDALAAPEPLSAADPEAAQAEPTLEAAAAPPRQVTAPSARGAAARRKIIPSKRGPVSASTVSKAAFVRSLPADVSFKEAAERAKAAGLSLSAAHFYAIKREADKRATALKLAAAARSNSKPVQPPTPVTRAPAFVGLRLASDDEREQALIDAVKALGVPRSRAVIDVVETMERLTRRSL